MGVLTGRGEIMKGRRSARSKGRTGQEGVKAENYNLTCEPDNTIFSQKTPYPVGI